MRIQFKDANLKFQKRNKSKILAWLNAIRYFITSNITWFISDIQFFGWPFFCIFRAHGYKINAEQIRKIFLLIKPGDILLRRFDRYLGTRLIPGFFTHAALYVGDLNKDEPDRVVHALGEGVVKEDLLKFLRCDEIAILRTNLVEDEIKQVIEKGLSFVGKDYDFDFDFGNATKFSCTELVYTCFKDYKEKVNVKPKKRLWKMTIVPDDFLSFNGKIIYNSRVR